MIRNEDNYDNILLNQIKKVEVKIKEISNLSVILQERVGNIGRDSSVIPPLQEILNFLMICFDKLSNEACRVVRK